MAKPDGSSSVTSQSLPLNNVGRLAAEDAIVEIEKWNQWMFCLLLDGKLLVDRKKRRKMMSYCKNFLMSKTREKLKSSS